MKILKAVKEFFIGYAVEDLYPSIRYWHELPDWHINDLIAMHITYGWLEKHYLQPDWCNYPEAIKGIFGCWSLIDIDDLRHKISRQFCGNCDCYKERNNESSG